GIALAERHSGSHEAHRGRSRAGPEGGGGAWGRLEAPSRSWARPGEAVSHALLQGSMPQKPGWLSHIRLILARVVLWRGRERRGHSPPTLPRFPPSLLPQ